MNQILIVAGLIVAWLILRPLLKLVIAATMGDKIAKSAMEKQPDTIHLTAAGQDAWKDRARADRAAGALLSHGYSDAGTWTIAELPGVIVRLLVNPAESMTAAVYEHPRAGSWCEIFCRGEDGTGATFSNLPPTGLKDRPGHPTIRRPGADPETLITLAQQNRPACALSPVSADTAPRRFEEAYAEAIAWRKKNGISRGEVVNVAVRRAA